MQRLILIPLLLAAATSIAQMPLDLAGKPSGTPSGRPSINAITQPMLPSGVIQLMELDNRFSQDVANGGGAAFASWFADDAIALNNKLAPVMGKARIADSARWDPKEYQLTWTPSGGQMGPSNDMGFTWGHYEGHSKDKNGQPVIISGRYITVWKKLPNGQWKVAMDASAEEPPNAGECFVLPKP